MNSEFDKVLESYIIYDTEALCTACEAYADSLEKQLLMEISLEAEGDIDQKKNIFVKISDKLRRAIKNLNRGKKPETDEIKEAIQELPMDEESKKSKKPRTVLKIAIATLAAVFAAAGLYVIGKKLKDASNNEGYSDNELKRILIKYTNMLDNVHKKANINIVNLQEKRVNRRFEKEFAKMSDDDVYKIVDDFQRKVEASMSKSVYSDRAITQRGILTRDLVDGKLTKAQAEVILNDMSENDRNDNAFVLGLYEKNPSMKWNKKYLEELEMRAMLGAGSKDFLKHLAEVSDNVYHKKHMTEKILGKKNK